MIIAFGVILFLAAGVFWIIQRKNSGANGANAKKLASSLRDEKQKSDIILRTIEDGVVLIDDQGVIQLFNKGASLITGWLIDEAEGLDFRAVIKLVDDKDTPYDDTIHPFTRIFREATTIRDNNAILVTRAEKQLPINISVSPIMGQGKVVTAAVAVFRDVTKERQEQAQRAEFISTASHEMRTPVAAIEGYLSLALNDRVSTIDSRARGYLEKAHASTRHLGELFQDLLTSAKAEDGRLANHPRVVEMGEFLEQLSEDLRFAAENKGLFMEYVIGTANLIDTSTKVVRPLYYVHADPDRLREVITNLFDNGVKYTDEGTITIGLTGNNDVVQMYLKDTGNGIPEEDIPHLFQKFYRVDTSATRTVGGTGLGLFISRKIIEMYNGRIWVNSTLGKGSTFYINLPRLTNERADELKKKEDTEIAS